jgi:hypothetical protein
MLLLTVKDSFFTPLQPDCGMFVSMFLYYWDLEANGDVAIPGQVASQ